MIKKYTTDMEMERKVRKKEWIKTKRGFKERERKEYMKIEKTKRNNKDRQYRRYRVTLRSLPPHLQEM